MLFQTRITVSDDAVCIRWTALQPVGETLNLLIPAAVAAIAVAGATSGAPSALPLLAIPAAAATAVAVWRWRYRGPVWIVIADDSPSSLHGRRVRRLSRQDVESVEYGVGPERVRSLGYRHTDAQADAAHIFLHVRGDARPEWIYSRPRSNASDVTDLARGLSAWLGVPIHGIPSDLVSGAPRVPSERTA